MKATRWLTEAFARGVDERGLVIEDMSEACWLAQFDRAERPCEGPYERFHFLRRQTVEKFVSYMASEVRMVEPARHVGSEVDHDYHGAVADDLLVWTAEIPLLAAWDSRNGGIGCEMHHRRFDHHLVSLPSEQIVVPRSALPEHVEEFAADWGLEDELEAKFEVAA